MTYAQISPAGRNTDYWATSGCSRRPSSARWCVYPTFPLSQSATDFVPDLSAAAQTAAHFVSVNRVARRNDTPPAAAAAAVHIPSSPVCAPLLFLCCTYLPQPSTVSLSVGKHIHPYRRPRAFHGLPDTCTRSSWLLMTPNGPAQNLRRLLSKRWTCRLDARRALPILIFSITYRAQPHAEHCCEEMRVRTSSCPCRRHPQTPAWRSSCRT